MTSFPVVAATWTLKDKPLFEALDIIHLMGVSDVELWAEGVHLDPRGELPDVGELASAMDRIGLAAHSIHGPFRGLDLTAADGGVRRRAVSTLSEVIELAAEIDCPYVVVHVDGAGETAEGADGTRDVFIQRAEAVERAAAALTVLCKHAEDLGVTLLIENQPDPSGERFGARIADLLELMTMVGAPNIGICFDVAHAVVSTGDWEAELKAALPHVRSVHASDTPGDADAHLPLGDGAVDWGRVVATLEQAGFDGGFVLEVAGGEEGLERSLDRLNAEEAD